MRRVKKLLCMVLPIAVAGALMPGSALGAVDMFIKFDSIKGESRDQVHKDEVDVLAWSWGVSNATTTPSSSARAKRPGPASFQDLSLTKYMDAASVPLFMKVSSGERIASARLVVRGAGEHPLEYYVMCLRDVGVTSISTGGSGGEDRLTEHVSLNYGSVSLTYQKPDVGDAAGTVFTGGWDLVRNLATTSPDACAPIG